MNEHHVLFGRDYIVKTELQPRVNSVIHFQSNSHEDSVWQIVFTFGCFV